MTAIDDDRWIELPFYVVRMTVHSWFLQSEEDMLMQMRCCQATAVRTAAGRRTVDDDDSTEAY